MRGSALFLSMVFAAGTLATAGEFDLASDAFPEDQAAAPHDAAAHDAAAYGEGCGCAHHADHGCCEEGCCDEGCCGSCCGDPCCGGCWDGCGSPCDRLLGIFARTDYCFNNFISPISNPLFFEDPRQLTEAASSTRTIACRAACRSGPAT